MDEVLDKTDEISGLLLEKLGLKGGSIGAQLSREARRLPYKVRRDLRRLAEAERMAQHPKLSRLIDRAEVSAAHRRARDFLKPIDPAQVRLTRILRKLAKWAGLLLLIFITAVWIAAERGLV